MNLYPIILSEEEDLYEFRIDIVPPKGEVFLKIKELKAKQKSSLELVSQELKAAAPYKTTTHEINEPYIFEVVGYEGPIGNAGRLQNLKVGDLVLVDQSINTANLMGTNTHTYVYINGKKAGPGIISVPEIAIIAIVKQYELNKTYNAKKRELCIKAQRTPLVGVSAPPLVH